jgi:hypothetical protein
VTVEFDQSGGMTVGRPGGRPIGKIETILESWRIDDEWWRHMIARAYLNVIMEGGKRLVLFQDLITGQWFVQMP